MANIIADYCLKKYGERFPRREFKETYYLVKKCIMSYWDDNPEADLYALFDSAKEATCLLLTT